MGPCELNCSEKIAEGRIRRAKMNSFSMNLIITFYTVMWNANSLSAVLIEQVFLKLNTLIFLTFTI